MIQDESTVRILFMHSKQWFLLQKATGKMQVQNGWMFNPALAAYVVVDDALPENGVYDKLPDDVAARRYHQGVQRNIVGSIRKENRSAAEAP